MALNPPVLPTGMPMGIVGEFYCLEAKGKLYLTTIRMCFVPSNSTAFRAVDLPLQGLSNEAFKQPIFGANYLEGDIAPVPGRGMTSPAKFKLTFNDGGCGTFLRIFFSLIEQIRRPQPAREAFFAPPRMTQFIQEQQAYVDPSDPSRLFIAQPAVTYATAPGVQPGAAPGGGWAGGAPVPQQQQQQPMSAGYPSQPGYPPGPGQAPPGAPSWQVPPAAASGGAGYGAAPYPQQGGMFVYQQPPPGQGAPQPYYPQAGGPGQQQQQYPQYPQQQAYPGGGGPMPVPGQPQYQGTTFMRGLF